MNHKFTADYITRRIEHGGATLRCLRLRHPSTLLAQGRVEIVRELMDYPPDRTPGNVYPTPNTRDIALMDEALSWILLIPNQQHRRVVGLRSQFNPIREQHMRSWREIGGVMKCSHVAAKEWHAKAMGLLVVALDGAEIKSPAGCNVIPHHISLDWLDDSMCGAA